jgi:hypothetical protein
MAGSKTGQRTHSGRLWRVIAGGVLGLWIGSAAADEGGPEFRYWIPGNSRNADQYCSAHLLDRQNKVSMFIIHRMK